MPTATEVDEARAKRRAETMRQLSDYMRLQREAVLLRLQREAAAINCAALTEPRLIAEEHWLRKPAPRTFVCQGCGAACAVLHGSSLRCGCGTTSSAELLR